MMPDCGVITFSGDFSHGLMCDFLQRLSMHLMQTTINHFVMFNSPTYEIRRHGDMNIMEWLIRMILVYISVWLTSGSEFRSE